MIWVTWRQHRGEAFVMGSVLVLLAAVLVLTGRDMAATYQQLGVGGCLANPDLPNCHSIVESFRQQYGWLDGAVGWLNLLPALLAMLVGAPLVARELEHGTHRLAWTQSVTRVRWLVVKLALVLGVCLVAAAILTGLLTWWRGPFDHLGGRLAPGGFDFEGTVTLAYVLFALALAIAAGALLRRAIPAMVVTVAGFLAVRLPIELWLRARYQPWLAVTYDPSQPGVPSLPARGDWVLADGWVDRAGHSLSDTQAFNTCARGTFATKDTFFQCAHTHGWLDSIAYQPADRFWLFQGIETAIFVAAAAALLALAVWWVRRRLN